MFKIAEEAEEDLRRLLSSRNLNHLFCYLASEDNISQHRSLGGKKKKKKRKKEEEEMEEEEGGERGRRGKEEEEDKTKKELD